MVFRYFPVQTLKLHTYMLQICLSQGNENSQEERLFWKEVSKKQLLNKVVIFWLSHRVVLW